MRKIYLLHFTALLIITHNVFAAEATDWDAEYKSLCSYDSKFCRRVKNSDGTFAKPKKEIVALLKELTPYIQSSAKTLGVDPRAIAGAIMAENSLNVGISDDVQNLLVKIGVADKGEILGKKFTYGLGQLNFQAAREAENYAASLEKRTPLSDKDLQDAILIPEKSIYLVGAVIRKVQDDYKKQGIDISGKPEILTTLYNLGRSEEKAAETKRSGNLPRPNYFGFFVNKYVGDLAFLKKPEVLTPIVPVVPASPAGPKKVTTASTGVKSPTAKEKVASSIILPSADPVSKKIKVAFTKSMPLYSSPPTCTGGQDYGATNIQTKYNSMKAYSVTAIADKEKTFTVVAPSVDCETNAWKLIKLSSGETGWIKSTDLEKNTSKIMVPEVKCKPVVDAKCVASVTEQLKDLAIKDKNHAKGAEIFAKPFSNSGKASFGKADWQCTDKELTNANTSGVNTASGGYPTGSGMGMGMGIYGIAIPKGMAPKNDLKDLDAMMDKISLKEKEIETFYQKPLTDPTNPFYGSAVTTFKQGVVLCANKQKYNLAPCQIDKGKMDEFLSSIPLDDSFSVDDRKIMQMNALSLLTGGDSLLSKDGYKKMQANNMMMGGGLGYFGNYSSSHLMNDQYSLKDGDEKKWDMDDVQTALKACSHSLDSVRDEIKNSSKISSDEKKMMTRFLSEMMDNSIQPAADTITGLLKVDSSKQKENWDKIQPFLIPISKMCLSLDDLFQLKNESNKSTPVTVEYTCYFNGLSILENQNELMLKKLVKESMYTPTGISNLTMQFQLAYNSFIPISLGIMPNNYMGLAMASMQSVEIETQPSYCPGKTADKIEEIVKNNSCIQRVYVPNTWMVNRLNELGDKVMFKPFAEDDRYSFDMEKTQCE